MTPREWPASAFPSDARLAGLVREAATIVEAAAPLSSALLGGPASLPRAGTERDAELLGAMDVLERRLVGLEDLQEPADQLDRLGLLHGLRRALMAATPGAPTAAETLEQHLQLHLQRMLEAPQEVLPELVVLVEHGPGFMQAARPHPSGGSRAAGELALAATGRLPLLLEACAGAGREHAPPALRQRLEAALGELLQAGAEESGWLLKEYLPAALDGSPGSPDTLDAGLAMTLPGLEAAAEAGLAEAVLAAPVEARDDPGLEELTAVRGAWERAAQEAARFGGGHVSDVDVLAAPPWLEPLLPPLSLVLPGPLRPTSPRLLVRDRSAVTAADISLLYLTEFLPWSLQRGRERVARLLLPSPDLLEGWRGQVLAGDTGAWPAWPRELAWRSALALAAISMSLRETNLEAAAALVAAESGLPDDAARLQCLHLRRHPLTALTFFAGRAAVTAALAATGPGPLLVAGPLPAVAAGRLG